MGAEVAQGAVGVAGGSLVRTLINGTLHFHPQLLLRRVSGFNCHQPVTLSASQRSRSELPNSDEEAQDRLCQVSGVRVGVRNCPLPLKPAATGALRPSLEAHPLGVHSPHRGPQKWFGNENAAIFFPCRSHTP